METPSSIRRVSRPEEERSALNDITNDSPIVGLAMQTPSSGFMCKGRSKRIKHTPGSGEVLLRKQVKTLLHKVEEGRELIHSMETRPFIHFVTSPMRLLAPTPANSPQFPNFSGVGVQIRITSPVVSGHFRASQEVIEKKEEKSMSITRSLLFDFTDKSRLHVKKKKKRLMCVIISPIGLLLCTDHERVI